LWNDQQAIAAIPETYEIDADLPTWNYRALRVIEELREQTEMFSCNGAVYTQTTDVEGEVNGMPSLFFPPGPIADQDAVILGFLTYDRVIDRLEREKWTALIQAIYDTFNARIEADKSK